MPKPRSIDPSFWDDPDIATLTRDERLLLVGMITSCADDEGRLLADPGYLRKRVFGYDDDVSKQDVQEWRDDIARKCRNVKLYQANGQVYMCFANWTEYQNIRYVIASKLPEYTEDCDELLSNKEDCGKLPQISVNSPSVALGSVGLALGGEAAQSAPPPPEKEKPKPPRKTLAAHPLPAEFGVTEAMRQWARDKRLTDFIDIDKHTARFIAYWTDGEGAGRMKKNWLQTWQNWMTDEAEKAEQRGARLLGGNSGTNRQGSTTGTAENGTPTGKWASRETLRIAPLASVPPETKAG